MLALLVSCLPLAHAEPPGWAAVPFGVGVYVHHRPVRGLVYSATQAAGISTAAWATVVGYDAAYAEDDAAFAQAQAVSIAGVSLAAVSYLASLLDASRLHELEGGDPSARARVMAWDSARSVAVLDGGGFDRGLTTLSREEEVLPYIKAMTRPMRTEATARVPDHDPGCGANNL
ncbi:MAG: hypothetical protein Q8P18_26920 [Pseudomonadota bacterium]|nr:hypothetical protein [Pseudomonadota bacterium]